MHSDIWLKGYKRFVVPADIFVTLNLHTPAIQKYVTNLYAPTLYRVKGKRDLIIRKGYLFEYEPEGFRTIH